MEEQKEDPNIKEAVGGLENENENVIEEEYDVT